MLISFLSGCGGGGSAGTAAPQGDPAAPESPILTAAIPSLAFGAPTTSGSVVTFPLNIANTQGKSISALEASIGFGSGYELILNGTSVASAAIGPAATSAGKQITQSKSTTQSDVLRIVISGGNGIIADGNVANISLIMTSGIAPNKDSFTVVPNATDPNGVSITIIGTTK